MACPPCRPEEVTTEVKTTGVGYPSHRQSLGFLVWSVHLLRLLQKQDLVVQACPQFVFGQSKTLLEDSNGLREVNQQLKLCSHFMGKKGPLFIVNRVAHTEITFNAVNLWNLHGNLSPLLEIPEWNDWIWLEKQTTSYLICSVDLEKQD